ncbi:glycosyltransferase [Clostridium perfringens]|nr:glycosyltransferase [Clostridium perfringens]
MEIKLMLKNNKLIVNSYRYLKKIFYPITLKLARVDKRKPQKISISNKKEFKSNIIISLTSFPGRIHLVHKAIYSIMNQTYKPNMIILWLSEEQFPKKEESLPQNLIELKSLGLSIRWLKNDLKSYKKLIPALKEFKNDIIITADDDLYYPKYWLESLLESYKKYPEDIHCHLVTRISYRDNVISIAERTKEFVNKSSFNNKLLGGSGTLYPPNSLSSEVFNEDIFTKLAPTSDDIWFWAMALKNKKKIRWINNNMKKLYYIEESQETDCLWKVNDRGEKLFYKHIKSVIKNLMLEDLLHDN